MQRWIEQSKQLKKQIRFAKPAPKTKGSSNNIEKGRRKSSSASEATATVYFRVKFFVEDPSRLNEEYTRYHVFLQLRKDILEGRLIISPSTACLLSSYAVQSELGDFNPEEHHDEMGYYLRNTEPNLLLLEGDEYLRKIVQLHKLHRGQTPADAEFNFLAHAKRLDTYGVNFHRVKDNLGKEILLGISSMGISVHHNGVKMNTFSWSKITKIAFKRKHFFIQLRRELVILQLCSIALNSVLLNAFGIKFHLFIFQSEEYDTLLLFDCWSHRSCKRLWKSCVEHHAFFRLSAPPPPNRRPTLLFLTLGSRFRYWGRTEYQTREETSSRSQSRERERRTFFRSPSKKFNFLRQTLLSGTNRARSEERKSHNSRGREEQQQQVRRESRSQDRGGVVGESNKENIMEIPCGSHPQLNTSFGGFNNQQQQRWSKGEILVLLFSLMTKFIISHP